MRRRLLVVVGVKRRGTAVFRQTLYPEGVAHVAHCAVGERFRDFYFANATGRSLLRPRTGMKRMRPDLMVRMSEKECIKIVRITQLRMEFSDGLRGRRVSVVTNETRFRSIICGTSRRLDRRALHTSSCDRLGHPPRRSCRARTSTLYPQSAYSSPSCGCGSRRKRSSFPFE